MPDNMQFHILADCGISVDSEHTGFALSTNYCLCCCKLCLTCMPFELFSAYHGGKFGKATWLVAL